MVSSQTHNEGRFLGQWVGKRRIGQKTSLENWFQRVGTPICADFQGEGEHCGPTCIFDVGVGVCGDDVEGGIGKICSARTKRRLQNNQSLLSFGCLVFCPCGTTLSTLLPDLFGYQGCRLP